MKKKLLALSTAIVLAFSASATISVIMSSWVKIKDDCNNCTMDDVNRICGKPNCKGFMSQVDGTGKFLSDGYLRYDYKCGKCEHVITYKNK